MKTQLLLASLFLLTACQPETETTPVTIIPQDLPPLLSAHTTVDQWQTTRRPEILELFRENVYGRNPVDRPQSLTFTVTHTDPAAMNGKATLKQLTINYAGQYGAGSFPVTLFIPNHCNAPAPAFIYINIGDRNRIDPTRENKDQCWPAEALIEHGYAAAAYQVDDLAPNLRPFPKVQPPPDSTSPVQSAFEPGNQPRPADAWGTIGVWAWGVSRILDYLETDSAIDAKRVAVIGHSRAGKTALWAGAQDQRFALVISNNSGSTGAALARGKAGIKAESIADINKGFPLWFCQNYKAFDNNEQNLPVDQHMLLALIAPRLLCVGSAADDIWAHPQSEFAATLAAQPVWKLYHLPTLAVADLPPVGGSVETNCVSYHIRPGPHGLTEVDWNHYIAFADKNLKSRLK